MGNGNANAAANIRGLNDHWIAKAGFTFLNISFILGEPGFSMKPEIVHDRDTGGAQDLLGGDFIHGQRRAEHTTPGIRDLKLLQHALKGAILSIGAVKNRKSQIDFCSHIILKLGQWRLQKSHPAVLTDRRDFLGPLHGTVQIFIGVNLIQGTPGVPIPVLGDVNGNDVVFARGFQMLDGLQGRNDGDFMLN